MVILTAMSYRWTDQFTGCQTDTFYYGVKQTEEHRDRQTTDVLKDRLSDRKTNRQTVEYTGRKTDKQTNGQKDIEADRQTTRQT